MTGRRSHLGDNKEEFDTETFAIYQALRALDQRQERGRRYSIFVDSTSAIARVRSDDQSPGQRFATAAIEVCTRILTRDNELTVRWVPAHSGATGNEVADRYAKAAAIGKDTVEIPEGYARETSLSHDKSGHRGQAQRDGGLDLEARQARATIQAPREV